jgi:hypothetical protein
MRIAHAPAAAFESIGGYSIFAGSANEPKKSSVHCAGDGRQVLRPKPA